ncbi:hypothetical protein SKAU_G00429030 [Synaphobranchus kaupii]|uniref:Caprin-1 dimerization domain-containing protein n=1 Tax=Synaphobranchus kaupii TaxID=118154 RepID=A0A9Q1E4L9_SYNKA|nr:hypothetical protein SKAU_G00429030 [Synaphobranchus kaupii]
MLTLVESRHLHSTSVSINHIFNTHRNRGIRHKSRDGATIPVPGSGRVPLPAEHSEEVKGSPKSASPSALSSLQLALSTSTTAYHSYDTYIEDGLICLKHKIRNIEKKRLKLEDYKSRLENGKALNQDQMEAVEKYDEVVHNLAFAKELQKTLGALTQDLLRGQKKMAKREQMLRADMEKKRLGTVLQVHHILQSLQQERVKKDFRSGLNHAPLPARPRAGAPA